MTESRIPELLAKLEKLDLGAWLILREGVGRVDAIMGETWDSPGNPDYHQIRCEKIREYTIQGVIQDAISARLWGVVMNTTIDGRWRAEIRSNMGRAITTRVGGIAAEAILAAYVVALEAQG